MDIRPIRNEEDYNWALAEIAVYFENEPAPGSPEGDRFDILAALIAAYEDRYWKIDAPDPVETIKVYMATRNRSRGDLAALLGSKSRASEALSGKRRLTLDMVHKINREWHIPADVMVAPYHIAGEKMEPRKPGRTRSVSKG